MKIQYLDVQDLTPTQPSVKLRNFREMLNNFNPEYFNPITFCRDGNRNLIVEGHHRSFLFYLTSHAFNTPASLPAKLERRVKGNSMFKYSNRTFDSISQMNLEISQDITVPASSVFVTHQDVYASINGSSQYLFTLPDIDLLQRAKTRHLIAA